MAGEAADIGAALVPSLPQPGGLEIGGTVVPVLPLRGAVIGVADPALILLLLGGHRVSTTNTAIGSGLSLPQERGRAKGARRIVAAWLWRRREPVVMGLVLVHGAAIVQWISSFLTQSTQDGCLMKRQGFGIQLLGHRHRVL